MIKPFLGFNIYLIFHCALTYNTYIKNNYGFILKNT